MGNNKRYYITTERQAENYIAAGEDEISKEIRKSEAVETRYKLRRQLKDSKDLSSLAA